MPNSHYKEPFDYSYTGLDLYYIDGNILLGDVAEGSPSQKAGLQEGDIIVAINKNFSNNLQQYKAVLQNAKQRVKIIILRDGRLMEFDMRVKNILSGK